MSPSYIVFAFNPFDIYQLKSICTLTYTNEFHLNIRPFFNLTIHSLHDFIFKSMRLYLHISSKCSLLLLFYSPLGLFIHCLSSFFYSSFSNARLHRFQLFFISLSLSFHASYPHKFSAD